MFKISFADRKTLFVETHKKNRVELGYNFMKGTEYFVSS
jgi:hypothetical protein